jgi:hypothetical protein
VEVNVCLRLSEFDLYTVGMPIRIQHWKRKRITKMLLASYSYPCALLRKIITIKIGLFPTTHQVTCCDYEYVTSYWYYSAKCAEQKNKRVL